MTDARATAAFPRSIRRWVAAPDRARPPGRVGGRLPTAARARVAEDDLTSAENDRWETVVGLELHAQVAAGTKLFSGCVGRSSLSRDVAPRALALPRGHLAFRSIEPSSVRSPLK